MADPQAMKFCTDLNKVQCDKLQACAPALIKVAFGDVKTCQDRFNLLCASAQGGRGSTVTPAMQTTCAQALTSSSCEDFFNGVPIAACSFKGNGANGASCVSDAECQTGNCAAPPAGQTCGACAVFVAAGGACQSSGECTPGLSCVTTAAGAGMCAALGKAGAPCANSDNCGFGFFCDGKACVAKVATVGGACNAEDACSDVKELICDATTLKCVQQQYSPAGGMCNATFTIQCLAGGDCLGMQGAMTGTCSAPAGDGQACSQNKSCMLPAACAGGTCRLPMGAVCPQQAVAPEGRWDLLGTVGPRSLTRHLQELRRRAVPSIR
jgi:hypothetical protein